MERYRLKKSYAGYPVRTVLVEINNDGYLTDRHGNSFFADSTWDAVLVEEKETVEDLVLKACEILSRANNTFTTLEVKQWLRDEFKGELWTQEIVRKAFNNLVSEDKLSYTDGGTFRIYSLINKKTMRTAVVNTGGGSVVPAAKPVVALSKTALNNKLVETKGKLVTIKFIKEDGDERVANGIYCGVNNLGNALFQEYKYKKALKNGTLEKFPHYHEFTQFNPKKLLKVSVGKIDYVVKK